MFCGQVASPDEELAACFTSMKKSLICHQMRVPDLHICGQVALLDEELASVQQALDGASAARESERCVGEACPLQSSRTCRKHS